MKESRSYAYIFTSNNYTDETIDQLRAHAERCRYIIWGKEVAPTTGTKHLQGYMYLRDASTMSAIHSRVQPLALLKAKGSALSNQIYCSKDACDVEEYGTKPKQGKRNDIVHVLDLVASDESIRDIIPILSSFQQLRITERLMTYYEKPRNFKPYVEWYYGMTGTGKTRTAAEKLTDAYWVDNRKWFAQYDKHENVIIDDIRREDYSYSYLLRLLDRYPFRVEYKGGERQFLAKHIIITAPERPEMMYYGENNSCEELLRRIDVVKHFA